MLRRRLLILVGPLLCLLMVAAIGGIWWLEGTLANMDYVNDQVICSTDQIDDFVSAVRELRHCLRELSLGNKGAATPMNAALTQARGLMQSIEKSTLVKEPGLAAALLAVQDQLPEVQRRITTLAAAPDVALAQLELPMAAADRLERNAGQLGQLARTQAHLEHQQLTDRFRRQVLIFAIVFLLMINLSIVALLRAASIILRPVDKLVKAAYGLGQEHFETRVQIDDNGEFAQLAQAYNGMAQQLQSNEQRKMEVLSQVALTINHELNNAINVIELQLTLLSRHAADAEALQQHLKQIRQSLRQMTTVVDALRHTRRIVLTDYVQGVKMLDLRQSSQPQEIIPPRQE